MAEFKITERGIVFVPRFVKSESDYNYGELVSHEAFNERINLNTTQGDYNTEILRLLFTDADPANVPHVVYLDKIIEDEVNRIDKNVEDVADKVNSLQEGVDQVINTASEVSKLITAIIDGSTSVGHATLADDIKGVDTVGYRKYYGTDSNGSKGFHPMPDSIYAEDISSGTVDISGIYYVPRENSVDESMLTEAVRTKINKQSISSYVELDGLPSINTIELKGALTLKDLGIQPEGNYLTEIPEEYVTDTELTETLNSYLTTENAANTYATSTTVTNLTNSINSVSNKAAVVCIGSFSGNPKTGDILITV